MRKHSEDNQFIFEYVLFMIKKSHLLELIVNLLKSSNVEI